MQTEARRAPLTAGVHPFRGVLFTFFHTVFVAHGKQGMVAASRAAGGRDAGAASR